MTLRTTYWPDSQGERSGVVWPATRTAVARVKAHPAVGRSGPVARASTSSWSPPTTSRTAILRPLSHNRDRLRQADRRASRQSSRTALIRSPSGRVVVTDPRHREPSTSCGSAASGPHEAPFALTLRWVPALPCRPVELQARRTGAQPGVLSFI